MNTDTAAAIFATVVLVSVGMYSCSVEAHGPEFHPVPDTIINDMFAHDMSNANGMKVYKYTYGDNTMRIYGTELHPQVVCDIANEHHPFDRVINDMTNITHECDNHE